MNLLQLLVHICGFKTNEGNKGQNKVFKPEVCKTQTCKTLFSLKTNFWCDTKSNLQVIQSCTILLL